MTVELLTNNFTTQLAGNVAVGDNTINAGGAAPVAVQGGQFRIQIDQELMLVTGGQTGAIWNVTRGIEGTAAAAHTTNAIITHPLTAAALDARYGTFNVLAYEAKGDGVTDDTTAIANAIAAAAASPAALNGASVPVVFPAGYTFVAQQIVVQSNICLWCYGAVITPKPGFVFTQGFVVYQGASGQILKNFRIYGGFWLGTGAEASSHQQYAFAVASGFGCQDITLRDRYYSNWGFTIDYPRNAVRLEICHNTIICNEIGNLGYNNTISVDYDNTAPGFGATDQKIEIHHNYIHNSVADSICVLTNASNLTGPLNTQIHHNIVTSDLPTLDSACIFQSSPNQNVVLSPNATPSAVGNFVAGPGIKGPMYVSSVVSGTLLVTATNGSTAVTLAAGSIAVPANGTVLGIAAVDGIPAGTTLTINSPTTGTLSAAAGAGASGTPTAVQVGSYTIATQGPGQQSFVGAGTMAWGIRKCTISFEFDQGAPAGFSNMSICDNQVTGNERDLVSILGQAFPINQAKIERNILINQAQASYTNYSQPKPVGTCIHLDGANVAVQFDCDIRDNRLVPEPGIVAITNQVTINGTQSGNRFSLGPSAGSIALVAGAASVGTPEYVSGDPVLLSRQVAGGALGHLSVGAFSAPIAAPAAPVPTSGAGGGTVAAGTYLVAISYTNAFGETVASAVATLVVSSTGTITIPSPPTETGATGWYAYVSTVNGTQPRRQQSAGSPTAIGTPLTLTAPPISNGAYAPTFDTSGGFTITSSSNTDTSTVRWQIVH